MNASHAKAAARSVASIAFLLASQTATAGPPFLTDDPEPIEHGHSEAYVFSTRQRTPDGKQYQSPAFEYNTSPVEDVHLHIMVPFAKQFPNEGIRQHGLGDIELGVKYRFVHESDTSPQVGIFPMLELPTGDSSKGLGNGRAWWTFPIWMQKSFGPWTTYGGGGRAFNSAPGMRDYNFAGWLLQRSITEKLILGGEVFSQGAATVGGKRSTVLNFGGYYNAIALCGGCNLLFRAGHSIAGESQSGAYLGLYWSWPTDGTAEKDK